MLVSRNVEVISDEAGLDIYAGGRGADSVGRNQEYGVDGLFGDRIEVP